jgi:CBS domain-containing protein
MRPVTAELVIGPDDSVFDALGKASRNGVGRLAVLQDARLVGYLSLKDITHVLALAGQPDGARTAHGVAIRKPGPTRQAA